MKNSDFVTDMAVEAAEASGLNELSKNTELSYGIVQRYLNVKSMELSKQLGRERGVYITYDCPHTVFDTERAINALTGYISSALKGLIGTVRKSTPVLVIGLGNGEIIADALGERTVEGVNVTKHYLQSYSKQRVCAMTTGVFGTTGMQSVDITAAVTDKIKPCAVILVDSLATSSVSRVGTSFQISTAGISPGGGVGQDKERIDRNVLGVPTIAIGVPLMLSMRTAIYNFVKEYSEKSGSGVDEYRLRAELVEKNLSSLVVAPKEIDYYVNTAALIISGALNKTFG